MQPPNQDIAPWHSGSRGARANLVPGLVLQVVALALVLGYYYQPAVHAALGRLSEARHRAGVISGIASTGLCGGLLPFLFLHFIQRDGAGRPRYSWSQGGALTAFWAYKGRKMMETHPPPGYALLRSGCSLRSGRQPFGPDPGGLLPSRPPRKRL